MSQIKAAGWSTDDGFKIQAGDFLTIELPPGLWRDRWWQVWRRKKPHTRFVVVV